MNDASVPPSVNNAIRKYILLGLLLLFILLAGIGGWTVMTQVSGAVIASGRVVVESNQKVVQHVEGGVVSELAVKEGKSVEAGDLLLSLDDTSIRAKLAVIERQIFELLANNLRLSAERDDLASLDLQNLPTFVDDIKIPEALLLAQDKLFVARKKSIEGQLNQLEERIVQNKEMINGLKTQKHAKQEELTILENRLARFNKLVKKSLLPRDQLVTVESEVAEARGEVGMLTAELARTKGMISELQYQIFHLKEQRISKVISELNANETRLAGLVENRSELLNSLSRLEIRAPSAGRVHQLAVHTVGGVLGAGEIAMHIVPENDRLIVEANLSPVDIDQVVLGQTARMRFSAFDQNKVPELIGTVDSIAADVVFSRTTGESNYPVRIIIEPDELSKLADQKLHPGIPVEVFIETTRRTVLSYLVEPLSGHISRAFRE